MPDLPEFEIEFDPAKNEANQKKHKVDFVTASLVFADRYRLERLDRSVGNPGEERWQTLGMVDRILFVVYVEKAGNVRRIVSARLATRAEKRCYYGNDQNDRQGWAEAN